jgi:uncharacterized protein with HEPN domain
MRNDDLIRLRHMLDAAREAETFARNKTKKDFENDRMLLLSIVKSIEIIGEAASRVTKESQDIQSEIPWKDIVAMRNRLIHVYFDIDVDRVWERYDLIQSPPRTLEIWPGERIPHKSPETPPQRRTYRNRPWP